MANPDGPFLLTAAICEKVLREVDDVPTVVRIFDRWTILGQDRAMAPTKIPMTLFFVVKNGAFRGQLRLEVQPNVPSGKSLIPIGIFVECSGGDDEGHNIALPLEFPIEEEGTYWFSVSLAGQFTTKMPLTVRYQQAQAKPSYASP